MAVGERRGRGGGTDMECHAVKGAGSNPGGHGWHTAHHIGETGASIAPPAIVWDGEVKRGLKRFKI
jgi:hypothetical protein